MTIFDHHALALRFATAMNARDRAGMQALVTEDFVTEWPQSGERVHGMANLQAILDNYPGGQVGIGNDTSTIRTQASDAMRLMAPSYTFVAVEGGGNAGTLTMKARYPDGSDWWVITLYRLREGRMCSSTAFFAPMFPAPEWRAKWVERIG